MSGISKKKKPQINYISQNDIKIVGRRLSLIVERVTLMDQKCKWNVRNHLKTRRTYEKVDLQLDRYMEAH